MNPLFTRRGWIKTICRDMLLGMLALALIFLPWKILELTKLTSLFTIVEDGLRKIGAPLIFGHLATVTISLGLLATLGWVVRRFVRSRVEGYPFIAGLLDAGDHIAEIFKNDGKSRVVLVDWPNPDVRSVAIITREIVDETTGDQLVVIYIPGCPNPTTGIMRIVRWDQLSRTNIKPSQVLSMSLSRGAMAPASVTLGARTPKEADEES